MTEQFSEDEVRELFLEHIRELIWYWATIQTKNTCYSRLEGLAFSILVLLDGGTDLPGFIVAPTPHKSDKEFHKSRGERWFPENIFATIECDIGGSLHELFYKEENNEPDRQDPPTN